MPQHFGYFRFPSGAASHVCQQKWHEAPLVGEISHRCGVATRFGNQPDRQASINRWAIRFLPLLEKVFRKHKHPVGGSWRVDETYIKVNGV